MIILGDLGKQVGPSAWRRASSAWQTRLWGNLPPVAAVFALAGAFLFLSSQAFHVGFVATLVVGCLACRVAGRVSHAGNQVLVAALALDAGLGLGLATSLVRRVALGETILDCLPWVAQGLPFVGGSAAGAVLSILIMGVQIAVIRGLGRPVFTFQVSVILDELPGVQMSIDRDIGAGGLPSSMARLLRWDVSLRGTLATRMEATRKALLWGVLGQALVCSIPLIVHLIRANLEWGTLNAGAGREACHLVGVGVLLQVPFIVSAIALRLMLRREDHHGPTWVRRVLAHDCV